MDKNDPNEDMNIPNVDSHDLFTSWGKNALESLNHDMECFGAYADIKSLFVDMNSPNGGIYISNIDIFIPFASGGKNPLDRGNRILDYFAAYLDKFLPFKHLYDPNEARYVPITTKMDPNRC